MDEFSGETRHRQLLRSWKEIASFFGTTERTTKRWEADRGLPVHRGPSGKRTTVYAYADELQGWLRSPNAAALSSATHVSGPVPTKPSDAELPLPAIARTGMAGRLTPWRLCCAGAALLVAVSALAFFLGAASRQDSLEIRQMTCERMIGIDQQHGMPALTDADRNLLADACRAGAEASRRTAPPAEAKSLYLSGIYQLETRTIGGMNRAIRDFTEAVARDPGYAEAYVGLASAYNRLSQYSAMPPEDAYPRARAAAERALALDDRLASAHAALAFNDFYWKRDFAGSAFQFQLALALDPNAAQTHHWYALTLMHSGSFDVPLREIGIAQQLDPASKGILANKGLILFHAGKVDEATALLQQLKEAEPDLLLPRAYLATIYLDQRRYADFLREDREAARIEQDPGGLAIADAAAKGFAATGESGLLAAMFEEQKLQFAQGRESAFKLAITAALRGDSDAAIAYLETSIRRGEQDIVGIRIDPGLRSLQADPRYQALVGEVGFKPDQSVETTSSTTRDSTSL